MTGLAPRSFRSAMIASVAKASSAGFEPAAPGWQPGDQSGEGDALDQRDCANGVIALAGQQIEIDRSADCVGQRQNSGRHAAFRRADGRALSRRFGAI